MNYEQVNEELYEKFNQTEDDMSYEFDWPSIVSDGFYNTLSKVEFHNYPLFTENFDLKILETDNRYFLDLFPKSAIINKIYDNLSEEQWVKVDEIALLFGLSFDLILESPDDEYSSIRLSASIDNILEQDLAQAVFASISFSNVFLEELVGIKIHDLDELAGLYEE